MPNPSDQAINDAINLAIGSINRKTRVRATATLSLSNIAAPPTYRGPWWVDISGNNNDLLLNTSEIVGCTWTDPNTNYPVRLVPVNWYGEDRSLTQFPQDEPGAPREYFVLGWQVAVTPAPLDPAGILTVTFRSGLPVFASDFSTTFDTCGSVLCTLDAYLPGDLQYVILYGAAMECAGRQATDTEMESRRDYYGGLFEKGIEDIKAWRDQYRDDTYQPSVTGGLSSSKP